MGPLVDWGSVYDSNVESAPKMCNKTLTHCSEIPVPKCVFKIQDTLILSKHVYVAEAGSEWLWILSFEVIGVITVEVLLFVHLLHVFNETTLL